MNVEDKLMRILDAGREPDASPELREAADEIIRIAVIHADKLPLKNYANGNIKFVESDDEASAYEKSQQAFLESEGQCVVDFGLVELKLRMDHKHRQAKQDTGPREGLEGSSMDDLGNLRLSTHDMTQLFLNHDQIQERAKLVNALDKAEGPHASPEHQQAAREMLNRALRSAPRLPLVNVDNGKTKFVREDSETSAYEKTKKMFIDSSGEWQLDRDGFKRMIREAHKERRRRQRKFLREATGTPTPSLLGWVTAERLILLNKVFKVLRYILRIR